MKKWKEINISYKSKGTSDKFSIGKIIKVLLENRGLTTKKDIEKFLHSNLKEVTIESVRIDKKQVEKAVKRIKTAIKKNSKIIVFGDYDVDGICGSAIIWETLFNIHKNTTPYIPHRVDEGYGLSIKAVDNIIQKYPDTRLIITVDNGIVATEAIVYAQEKGIDVIVTDHHVGAHNFPPAYAVIHTIELCGAGVAWLFSKALDNKTPEMISNHLELAAIATITDLVPLFSANRAIVTAGIAELRRTCRVGLLELCKEAGIEKGKIGVYEIGHIIGPRINAMGRLFHGIDSLRLLCTKDTNKARIYAAKLGNTNKDRQSLTLESALHAKDTLINTIKNSKIAFVAHEEYNQGVIGLIASKLVEEYYRPAFAISIGETISKGSARSIAGVNVIEMIRSVSHTIVQAGGHPMAAGFTVETTKIEEFRLALESKAKEIITDDLLERTLLIDLVIPLNIINFELVKALQKFEPFGIGNPEPFFASRNVIIEDMGVVGKSERKHLKLLVSDNIEGRKKVFPAIAFGMGDKARELHIGDSIDIAFTINEDTWRGNNSIQLKIKDIKLDTKN